MIACTVRRACSKLRRLVGARRKFLRAGTLGTSRLALANLLRHEALAGAVAGRGASVSTLWMGGGPSHIDVWEPKPEPPLE